MYYGDGDSVAEIASTIPMRRFVHADDVAATCLFLASPEAAFVTGTDITVHGGGELPPFLRVLRSHEAGR